MKSTEKKRILVIEDEQHIAEGLKLNLELQDYAVCISTDGANGLLQWKTWRPDLIVLDIMLPGIDGLSVLQNIRIEDDRVPILILSAKGTPHDRVKGFSYGVDDYLAKPFNLEEFLLRVKRLLIRSARFSENKDIDKSEIDSIYMFGDNRIDFDTLSAYGPRGEVHLTEQEIKILKLFIANRGRPVSRSMLLEIGWGYPRGMKTRTVDNFIVRFRKYFEKNPKKPVFFKSLRSVGYVFDHDA